MVRYRTRPDGTRYPIDDSRSKGGGAAIATVAAVVVAASGGGLSATSLGEAGESALSDSIQTQSKKAEKSARKGDYKRAWRQMRVREIKKNIRKDLTCSLNSFGKVQQFFIEHPCRKLDRAVLVIGDGRGDTSLVSIAWVRMRSQRSAKELKNLDNKSGSGDISTAGSTLLQTKGVKFTGEHYAGRLKGPQFVRAEAVPLTGSMNSHLLDAIANISSFLPSP